MSKNNRRRQGIDRRRLLGLAAACLAGTTLRASRAAEAHARIPIGMNLAPIADWEPGFPFVNLMWGARPWETRALSGEGPWNTGFGANLPLDDAGYPLEVPFLPHSSEAAQYVHTALPNTLKPGRYVILYDGDGIIGLEGDVKLIASRPGRTEAYMGHHGGDRIAGIAIRRSRRGNHVRNIRVLAIEHEATDLERNPFRPEVLDFCKPWRCLRFMDWQQTNNSTIETWSGRKKPAFYTQVGAPGDVLGIYSEAPPPGLRRWSSGVALELCLALANQCRTDAWLCVPHMADDDAIRQMAQLVKAQLDPSLKVYVEFSNELWNRQFLQAQWMLRSERAAALVEAAGAPPPWKAQVRPSAFRHGIVAEGAGEGADHPERIGALLARCFRIWEEVFSGPDRVRLVRVCAVQAHWADATERTLKWVLQHGGCDALAPAAYFGPDDAIYGRWEAAGNRLSADDVISDMRGVIATEATIAQQNAALAKAAGVRLVAYEGGQHIQSKGQADTPYAPALEAAQRHPAMYDLYRANIDAQVAAGLDLLCAYHSVGRQGARWGSWGHVDHYGQSPSEAPKYRALLDANARR